MLFDAICDNSKSAIDIGCGNGLFTKSITDKFERILSIDINPIRVKNLKEYFENTNIHNVTVLEMSAYCIENNDCSFDRAIFYRSVDHIQDYRLALQEAYRVLKNQGKIYINILDTRYSTSKARNLDDFRNFADKLYDILKIGESMCEVIKVDINKLNTYLSEVGFIDIETEVSETGSVESYFERINKEIIELLGHTSTECFDEHTSYAIEYEKLLGTIKSEGIEFRPTLEIVGMK